MLEFQERYGSVYLVDTDNQQALQEISEPTLLFDQDVFTVLKIGQKEQVESYYEKAVQKCRTHASDLFESFVLMDLPKNAELLNRIWHHAGFLETFLKTNGLLLNQKEKDDASTETISYDH